MAWITADLTGGPLYCSVGPEEWVKGGHHATWFPDGKRISMNLKIDRECLRFVEVDAEGTNLPSASLTTGSATKDLGA